MDLKNKNIAAIIAHPDDETIGCGGLLSKASKLGAICKVVLPLRRADPRGVEHWQSLTKQFKLACKQLGAEPMITEDSVEDLTADMQTQQIYKLISDSIAWADIVLCHWRGDAHQAHHAISRAVELATRPFRNHKTVLCFEIPSSTDQAFTNTFSPNCFVHLDEFDMQRKKSAMKEYTTEIVAGRTPENLEYLMRVRGAQIGVDYAEAYYIARHFIF